MPHRRALQPAALEPSRARLAALHLRLAERETSLAAATAELQALQTKYLEAVGGFYRQLVELEKDIAEIEIAAGLRTPDPPDDAADSEDTADMEEAAGCSNRGAPATDLKAMYRNLARTIHPDLALDGAARLRRHSLMAEANRAYAERDADRLRLILHTWERNPDSILDDAEDADEARVRRRIALVDDRLLAIDAEFADLHASAIWQLKRKIDTAKEQGWDLFAEMVLEVTREVRRATAQLASLRLRNPGVPPRS